MAEEKIYLDQKGYEEYQREIEHWREKLATACRKKTSSYGESVGDGWHDNFEFEEAKRLELMYMGELERKLNDMSKIVIIENHKDEGIVDIGDVVKLKVTFAQGDTEEAMFKLIGGVSPTMVDGVQEISLNSPLGAAIYKKQIKENTSYTINGDLVNVHIMDKW